MRQRLNRYNSFMEGVDITLPGYPCESGIIKIRDDYWVHTANSTARRIFNEQMEWGGRCYNLWPQQVQMRDNPVRKGLQINGEAVVELDYHCLHPRLLYATVGAPMPADPYSVSNFQRSVSKIGLNVILNALNERSAIGALASKQELGLSRDDAKALILELKAANPAIARFFHTGAGRWLMRLDSDMCADAVDALVSAGRHCLPVHDSVIVPERDGNALKDAMDAAFKVRYPHATVRIDEK
jgi:hypothetical protein